MKKIITIAGSNSKDSINKSLLLYTSNFLENVEIISIDLNDYELPIYGVDYETENGEPFSLTSDTDFGKESSIEILMKYLFIREEK